MMRESGRLDYWRKYFRSANSDIFDVIENAILVAASDCPKEFRNRRDHIAETLFSCRSSRCLSCDHVELQPPEGGVLKGGVGQGGDSGGGGGGGEEKESKVNSSANNVVDNMAYVVSNYSYDEAEALTEEIEEENQTTGEVLRIKKLLLNRDESHSSLFESLRRLQLMAISVEILQATEIGKTVKELRKHSVKQIRNFARTLIDNWKELVNEWAAASAALAAPTPESTIPSSFDDDEGLPLPPLDEGIFLAPQTTSIQLSKFFDGMDDDGNLGNIWNEENGKKAVPENHRSPVKMQALNPSNLTEYNGPMRTHVNDSVFEDTRKRQEDQNNQSKLREAFNRPTRPHESLHKQSNSLAIDSGSGSVKHPKLNNEHKLNTEIKYRQRPVPAEVQKKGPTVLPDVSIEKNQDDNSIHVRLEIAKRKLQERYQEAENAKKQRTIQVMELHDLPRQGLCRKPPHMKQGSLNRHCVNGRR